ncbi:conserved Plasmodium protein, unknown function [Babesia microti strain RI]|uniref:Uncharacterized protein n=1 Tax=Babesia microti (strain RI) TaxID=1133968 RepID=A0A1R4AAS7_BABMR|nr:conserved Plasmodium protein, unknown function [Babesia microti strain RI]SJK86106.1 conserved Plasmodium protein, unknown function [Babesia microti strain RI]|eukprot:XP_021338302.1 conserved Plasmodium protein, unknown function [Babesia microti strain RI]
MNQLSTATPETSPISRLSLSTDWESKDVPNPLEILKMDKQGMSDVSLSTRLALRKNTESIVPVETEYPRASAPKKRGRPRKNPVPVSTAASDSRSKPSKSISVSGKYAGPKISNDDITAIVDNMDELFRPTKSLLGPEAFNASTLKFIEMSTGITCSPLVSQSNIANIGILKIQPLTHYGPYINVQRGFIVLIILNSEPGKLTFDSGHDNLGPAQCDNNTQLMVCPNDMFMLHNTSSSMEAEVLMILCHSLGNDVDHLKDIKYAY